ncbi:MAG: site-2 protease family protein [Chloroflexota bacterium]
MLFAPLSLEYLLAAGIVLLFGMGWHEYAHAVVADWWGDPTPRQLGRLTPNPLVHISWIGWLMFLVLGFGILGSVPINAARMRDPRWGSFWTSAAGPISNLIQALFFGVVGFIVFNVFGFETNPSDFFSRFISTFIWAGVYLNVLLIFFNLLPFVIPAGIFSPSPIAFDGWHMIYALLPGAWLNYRTLPAVLREELRPLGQFIARPADKWRDWMNILGYITLAIFLLSFIPNNPLDPVGFLIGRPTGLVTQMILSFF